MRISIPLAGTRGDIQPAVALGLRLSERGHEVTLGVPPNLISFTESAGLRAMPFGPDVHKLYSSDRGQAALASGSTFKLMPIVAQEMADFAVQMDTELIEICEGTDLIVASLLTEDRSQIMSQALNVPMISTHTYPCRVNSQVSMPGGLPHAWKTPGIVNRGSFVIAENMRRIVFRKYLNALRTRVGLPSSSASVAKLLEKQGVPEPQIYDGALVPGLAQEWAGHREIVGYIPFPRSARAAVGELAEAHEDVLEWLRSGPPPIYFGLGSMPIRDAAPVAEMLRAACRELGQRSLISVGASDISLESSTADSLVVGALAHDLVMPHCVAAVHHGGVGTTHESLLAGLPTLVCAVAFDQPMWGHQLHELGVGGVIAFPKLSRDTLLPALRHLLDPTTKRRAIELSAVLRDTGDPTDRLVEIIENDAA